MAPLLAGRFRVVALGLCLLGCFGPPAATAASMDRHVILITVDGLASYYLADSRAPIPTLRRLAAEGASAEGMRVGNPAITWPNHTTLVTGVRPSRHSVLFNGLLVRPGAGMAVRIDSATDKSALVTGPTLYDVLHQAGHRTADINWPCTRGAATLDDSFPDVPDQISHMTPRLRTELIESRWLQDTNDAAFRDQSAAGRDLIWTAAATNVIRRRQPNLLLVHLLVTDSIQHKYGPQSPAAYTALAVADAQIAEILRAVDAAGLRERTTVFVVADHGFATALKIVNPNVAFRKAGLLDPSPTPTLLRARAQIVSEGGIAMLYLTNPATQAEDRAKVIDLMQRQEGIASVVSPTEFATLGLPDPSRNPQMADLVLVAKSGYAFGNESRGEDVVTEVTLASGNQGHHGLLSDDPRMNAAFLAWGRGIRPGAKVGTIENVDVAPTIARLLGQRLADVDGRVLTEILTAETTP